jgi:hypothetical protein
MKYKKRLFRRLRIATLLVQLTLQQSRIGELFSVIITAAVVFIVAAFLIIIIIIVQDLKFSQR